MPSRLIALALLALSLAAAVSAAPAAQLGAATVSTTTFLISGRGFGHGVGMSQYGALGLAKRGVVYDRILAHFYPGTELGPAPVTRIRVLLGEGLRKVAVSSSVPFRVDDGTGSSRDLPEGRYVLGPGLRLRLGPGAEPEPLTGPLTFLPGSEPLRLNDRAYRGTLSVGVDGKELNVVNSLSLEAYVRGVVSMEVPDDWPLEAVKAQAVAARSYALAQRRGGAIFDVYADTRDQVYGGVAAETPVTDEAVSETRRQVVTYGGSVATTYYFSSSGGRTAAFADVFGPEQIPYLVSVPDPYDTLSPYHHWGPVAVRAGVAARRLGVPGLTELRPVPAGGRAREVVAIGLAGEVTLPATGVRRALELRSTWLRVGLLRLARPSGAIAPGAQTVLTGAVRDVDGAILEQRAPGADWEPGPDLELQADGSFSVAVAPSGTTQYRLSTGEVKGGVIRVQVAS